MGKRLKNLEEPQIKVGKVLQKRWCFQTQMVLNRHLTYSVPLGKFVTERLKDLPSSGGNTASQIERMFLSDWDFFSLQKSHLRSAEHPKLQLKSAGLTLSLVKQNFHFKYVY